eukprot:m.1658550 g.1658550  ORF g.1658550 m.1658550 type:complete len:65 (-) comp116711_c0_seq1:64-258(-)
MCIGRPSSALRSLYILIEYCSLRKEIITPENLFNADCIDRIEVSHNDSISAQVWHTAQHQDQRK